MIAPLFFRKMATRETLERIKKHLMILKEFPDSFNRCFNLLNQINEGKVGVINF